MFVANNCPPCDEAANFLDENGVDYTSYNINESDDNVKKFRRFNSRALPLIIIDGERIQGFDRSILSIAVNNRVGTDAESQEVVIYTTKQCGWCRKATGFFQKHDIDFVEYDIGESKNKQQYDELGGRGTPLIYIGGNRIDGFNEKAVKMALRKVGLM
ncbi:MAG: hypothetical protein GY795_20845 [Desulfobacterales bacterium]|nr:hypothetical protein [Desulfobacterales bacterium]